MSSGNVVVGIMGLKPRRSELSRNVAEFQVMIGADAPERPMVPDHLAVRQRLVLIAEEFYETLMACGVFGGNPRERIRSYAELRGLIYACHIQVGLPEFAKELADLKIVTEGTEQAFGINGDGTHAVTHKSNMSKAGAGKDEHGKWRKGPDYVPPDIAGELRRQGWRE